MCMVCTWTCIHTVSQSWWQIHTLLVAYVMTVIITCHLRLYKITIVCPYICTLHDTSCHRCSGLHEQTGEHIPFYWVPSMKWIADYQLMLVPICSQRQMKHTALCLGWWKSDRTVPITIYSGTITTRVVTSLNGSDVLFVLVVVNSYCTFISLWELCPCDVCILLSLCVCVSYILLIYCTMLS